MKHSGVLQGAASKLFKRRSFTLAFLYDLLKAEVIYISNIHIPSVFRVMHSHAPQMHMLYLYCV